MPSMPAWRERGLLVAFTERGDLTILIFLYDILIVIVYGDSKSNRFNKFIQSSNYNQLTSYMSSMKTWKKTFSSMSFFPFVAWPIRQTTREYLGAERKKKHNP